MTAAYRLPLGEWVDVSPPWLEAYNTGEFVGGILLLGVALMILMMCCVRRGG